MMRCAVLGSPIAHSRSPRLQEEFARGVIPEFSYIKIETTCDTLHETVGRLVSEGYSGFNCTMPLKTDMAGLCDEITREAEILRSVNTVTIRDGRLYGDTTDGRGILLTVRRALGMVDSSLDTVVRGKRVLLLGAGGAARSVALSMALGGAELTVLNRTVESAEKLCVMLSDAGAPGVSYGGLTLPELRDAAETADILVNCTAAGMTGKAGFESLSFLEALCPGSLVIDAVYEPLETELLKRAGELGLKTASGLWMLVYQGALAFGNWTGNLPDEDACLRAFDVIKG